MKLVHFPEQPPVTTCGRIPGKYSTLIQIFIVFVFMMNFAIGDAICVGLSTLAKRAGLIGFVLQQLALFCKVLCYYALLCTVLYYFALGLFCNSANIFGTLSSTPCVYFMLNLNNFSWQFAKIFLNELKIPPFLYSGSEVHYWLLIVKKITFNGIVLFLERLLTKSFHRGILALLSFVAFFFNININQTSTG